MAACRLTQASRPMEHSVLPNLDQMQTRADEAARLLKALANPQRLRMLCLLVDHELAVGEINQHLPELSQSALSQHLAKLREEGLVDTRREAQSILYSLPPGPAQAVISALYGIYCAPRKPARRARPRTA